MTDERLFQMMVLAVRAGTGALTGAVAEVADSWRRDWEVVTAESDDGKRLIQAMRGHRCLALVLKGLEVGTPDADQRYPLMGWLRRGQASLLARSIPMTSLLCDVTDRFAQAGFRALPVKGPAMAAWLYGDPAFRPSEDLDIWIHPDDFMRAGEYLKQAGFKAQIPLTQAEAHDHMRAGWDRAWRTPAGDLVVELCSGVCPRYFARALATDQVMDRPVAVSLGGREVLMPSPELMLVWLCLHGAKHGWDRLIWLVDVHLLLARTPRLDWSLVWGLADLCGARTMLACGVALSYGLFRGEIPDYRPPPVIRMRAGVAVEWIQDHMMVLVPPSLGWREEIRLQWLLRDRVRDRLRYSLLSIMTPGYHDWKAVKMPDGWRWLYWLIRPVRLVMGQG